MLNKLLLGPALIFALALANVPATAADAAHDTAGHPATDAGHAAEAGHGADAHGDDGGVLSPNTQLAIWTAVVFAMLLATLKKFAWGPISAGLDRREERITSAIATAEQANQDAQKLLGQYEAKLATAADEVRKMIEEARRDAEHTQKDILAKANVEAQHLRDRAVRDIETATAQALKELAERSANVAVELAGKIVRSQLGPADHARLIDEAVAKFGSPSKN
ncbi:MAG: F0F1 ATP synthase subunit B [Pirellulales bacterium]|nr:F0F1 ATP synthase subunit B [Pirellulales bacterium]